ncbi:MAG: hypothetical protein ACKOYM_00370 [Actinomycetes bacterium]
MTTQLAPHTATSTIGPDHEARRWSPSWIIGVVLVTVLVDVAAIWMMVQFLGPIGLVTFAALALGGLYLVATRTSYSTSP